MSYVESKMVNASGRMAELLATDMYLDGQGTGSPTTALDGFNAAWDNGSQFATYGGVTRSDIVANGTANQGINGYYVSVTPLTLAALQTAFGSAWFGSEHVDLISTTQAVWDILWNKIQPQQRFMEESSDIAKIGFMALKWNGASITVDQYAPAGNLYGMNTKYIQFWISTLAKYQFGSNVGPSQDESLVNQSALIKLNPEMGTDCKQGNRAAVETERADTLRGDATVRTASNGKMQKMTEMIISAAKAVCNKIVTGWKESLTKVLGLLSTDRFAPAMA